MKVTFDHNRGEYFVLEAKGVDMLEAYYLGDYTKPKGKVEVEKDRGTGCYYVCSLNNDGSEGRFVLKNYNPIKQIGATANSDFPDVFSIMGVGPDGLPNSHMLPNFISPVVKDSNKSSKGT